MVMGLLAKLLLTKQLKFENGLISLKDITMTLLPTVFVGEITKYFFKEKKMDAFYMLSWYWGYVLVSKVKDRFGLKTPDEVYSLGMDLGEAMGIGIYKTRDYHPGRYTHFEIKNNPFIKYLNPKDIGKQAIDYFISGSMAGGGSLVHGAVCQNVETKCKMAGQGTCDFLTGTEKELKTRELWKTAMSRYNLKKFYPLQKEIFDTYTDKKEEKLLSKIVKHL